MLARARQQARQAMLELQGITRYITGFDNWFRERESIDERRSKEKEDSFQ